ncbi:MAG: flavoprotein [Planctomycetota bacterium]|nr:flavoprotein [Planctomycetota bacterium]
MARVLVGVGGSIAAYKACDLVSKLVQAGHTVDVVMTREAGWFVTPLAFNALTHRETLTDDTWTSTTGPAAHLAATEQADLFVVAPCTANLIGKFAHGIADEIVSTTYLGSSAPVLVAPAMNTRMWKHPRVQANVKVLEADGVTFVGPETGYLAEAEEGEGRMSEPATILAAVESALG